MVKKPDYQKKNTYGKYNNGNNKNENSGGYQGKSYNSRDRRSTYSRRTYTTKVKVDETLEDIKQDIVRIEKEIRLELKEIRSLKLGL